MTVNDVVMALCTTALRRWLLDHDGLPDVPIVVAVPVSIRGDDLLGSHGNEVSVMLAELPTHLADPRERLDGVQEAMAEAKEQFDAVPATILQDVAAVIPTALSGLAARALFQMVTVGAFPFNLFVSNVPGPQLPLYVGGARVLGIYPVSAITDLTGALNITLFSYDGALDFGLIAVPRAGARRVEPDRLPPRRPGRAARACAPSDAGAERRARAPSRARALDAVDERRPQLAGQVVAHAGDEQQLGTRDGPGRGPAARHVHQPVARARG